MTDAVEFASVEALLAAGVPEDTAEIRGVGMVRVRGLTRAELHLLTKKDGGNPKSETSDLFYFTHGMVEPRVTEDQARRIFESIGFGALQPVIAKISQLSGVSKDDQKAAYKSLRDDA
jgi:hypothetical protein